MNERQEEIFRAIETKATLVRYNEAVEILGCDWETIRNIDNEDDK